MAQQYPESRLYDFWIPDIPPSAEFRDDSYFPRHSGIPLSAEFRDDSYFPRHSGIPLSAEFRNDTSFLRHSGIVAQWRNNIRNPGYMISGSQMFYLRWNSRRMTGYFSYFLLLPWNGNF